MQQQSFEEILRDIILANIPHAESVKPIKAEKLRGNVIYPARWRSKEK